MSNTKQNVNTKIIAVIKAYAYGHGDIIVAKKIEKIGGKVTLIK